VTLTDAGPLVALIDSGEPDHARCRGALGQVALPLVTTWPAFTEAMDLVARAGGWQAQDALWRLVRRSDLLVADLDPALVERCATLMKQYADLPMDLADASLVALAERDGHRVVFTLDSDFRIYQLSRRRHLRLIPD
jgi:uncharacterized protein